MENWKDINGYEGYYQVSNFGKVMSMGHKFKCKDGKVKAHKSKVLKPCIGSKGYLHINLCKEGTRKSVTVHSLVANAFVENKFNLKEIDHRNGIKTDNQATNLKWTTRQGNLLSQNWMHKRREGKVRGVHHNLKSNRFISNIYLNGKTIYLGSFSDKEAASTAYQNKLAEFNLQGKDMRG